MGRIIPDQGVLCCISHDWKPGTGLRAYNNSQRGHPRVGCLFGHKRSRSLSANINVRGNVDSQPESDHTPCQWACTWISFCPSCRCPVASSAAYCPWAYGSLRAGPARTCRPLMSSCASLWAKRYTVACSAPHGTAFRRAPWGGRPPSPGHRPGRSAVRRLHGRPPGGRGWCCAGSRSRERSPHRRPSRPRAGARRPLHTGTAAGIR